MAGEQFVVGGVALERPFRIRRLGHFGINMSNAAAARDFYAGLFGFRVADPLDFRRIIPEPRLFEGLAETTGYFLHHGTDHHSFVVFPRPLLDRMAGPHANPEVSVNQITWQVGTLREVVEATRWLAGRDIPVARRGRDTPGSNWHAYPVDPEGHINEMYYGIEQIGWFGRAKPWATFTRGFEDTPPLPQMSEADEMAAFTRQGVDLTAGHHHVDPRPAKYDVGGILLPRPFKIVRVGPVRLFVRDVAQMTAFYRDTLGLTVTEEVRHDGHRCVFLRANTEHHSIALYPIALRAALGLDPKTTLMSFGFQLGDYRQLRDAIAFLAAEGVRIVHLPPELFPGIEYSAFAIDPDGHALQLYFAMEQIGWDGKPRPAHLRRAAQGAWPETLPATSDMFVGEPFLGPIG
ncbi:MAG: extradiol dioxygenase [Alphaproteobacteria bacterium]|nr:extradiol dioxygenase [Alphaproteobacteria bacterium]